MAGVVDIDVARADGLARRLPGVRPFSSVEAGLSAGAIDVVHICTPPSTHGTLIRAALAGHCHVLAEKPLAATAAETADLLAVATSVGRLLVPVHQYGFQPGVLRLLASRPVLGRITHLEVACASAGAQGGSETRADEVAIDILPHCLGLSRLILDISLAEQQWSVVRLRPGEWRVTARCPHTSIAYVISMASRPTFAELRVLGEGASARADLFHGFAVFDKSPVSRAAKAARPFRMATSALLGASGNLARRIIQHEPAYPGLTELVRRFHLAAIGKEGSPILPVETLDIAKTRDQLIALAR